MPYRGDDSIEFTRSPINKKVHPISASRALNLKTQRMLELVCILMVPCILESNTSFPFSFLDQTCKALVVGPSSY